MRKFVVPAAISLIVAIVFFRLAAGFSGDTWMESLANFSPMAALVLCAGHQSATDPGKQ